MKLFNRQKQPPQPIINDPHNSDTVAMPIAATAIMPAIESVKTIIERVLIVQCAHCHVDGANHLIHSGDFYIGAVDWYLCDVCHKERIKKHLIHVTSQRKTRIETPAVRKETPAVKLHIQIDGKDMPMGESA